ncbi:MAG: APC family permease [Bacteroidetes bacterium]|nr:APC family permease [Bacteroidota bacterium]
MNLPRPKSYRGILKMFFIGKARDIYDEKIFHKVTLIAFFAWIGLGSDGLSSSCYGPEESFRVLGHHYHLSIFIALGIAVTIFLIGSSYSQIIKLFPSGGGGYKVATKLLSAKVGMVSGCALIVDYILTIAMSVSSGTDALFSLFPPEYQYFKLFIAIGGVCMLIVMNLRGVKESVFSLMPIFILFVLTHAFLIIFSIILHYREIPGVCIQSVNDFRQARQSLGLFGILALMMRSYSMGAGTYTGLEAVSNSVPVLKDPKVKTGLLTMRYMIFSLAITCMGLMFTYSLFDVIPSNVKTLNAVLLDSFTLGWGEGWAISFSWITLFAEAALLFIAAQTGFIDGPRVISSMAQDNWFPRRFTVLSDRLVTQNGVLFMGLMAVVIVMLTKGSVRMLVVLYSINVFITFSLSQAGMVRHWWQERRTDRIWLRHLFINGLGFFITVFILVSVVAVKFTEGGWVTIVITSSLIGLVSYIKNHYTYSEKLICRMNHRMFRKVDALYACAVKEEMPTPVYDEKGRTAVICVSGYNGLGIQTFFKVKDQFREYTNFIFLEVGIVDSGNFKGNSELENLRNQISKYPHSIFFVGQFIIPKATAFQRLLHNQTQLTIQNRLSHKGFILVMVPIRSHSNV